jgi:hypothetical protein
MLHTFQNIFEDDIHELNRDHFISWYVFTWQELHQASPSRLYLLPCSDESISRVAGMTGFEDDNSRVVVHGFHQW